MTLHEQLLELRKKEKRIGREILEKLQRMENLRSYLQLGYSSLFDYLVRGLGYSQSRAYERQSCVRLTEELPEIKDKIDQGKLSYSTLSMAFKTIRKKSTAEKRQILEGLENKSAREVKKMLAEPLKPVQITRSVYQEKVVLRLEVSHEVNLKLEKLKALKSHQGRLEDLLEKMIDRELKRYESTDIKKAKSNNPRYISRRLENHLLKKANYRCQFPGCETDHFLQVDHIKPVRAGGLANPKNLQILCAAHNRLKG